MFSLDYAPFSDFALGEDHENGSAESRALIVHNLILNAHHRVPRPALIEKILSYNPYRGLNDEIAAHRSKK